MKKSLKRILSSVLAATMVVGTGAFVNEPFSNYAVENVYAASYLTESAGWFESAYAEWTAVPNATGYAAYVKGAGEADSAYKMLDNELVRKYPTYFRADAVGLKAGNYVMKIVPYVNGKADESLALTTGTLNVKAYDRSGAAFSSKSKYKTGSGAYNDDGTLKSNAIVVYVTKDTAKTVQATLNGITYTGFQDIVYGKQKGDTTPLDIRIIGTIDADDMDSFGSSAEGLQVKGKNSYAEMNMTIEGIGEDAQIKNFGILCRNAGNVEFRNFGIMLCMDDSLSLDTDNANIWVHNMDLFYGSTGGDADQAKGDGTVDVKGQSSFVTISYNHFWDSGKSSLCGMKSETTDCQITYHHNWFDHSDSRHPRIRTMTVHIYNNYFDGNSKYGVGVTMGSSAFVENNYFENCKHPMLSSMQGSDIEQNTFAEDGVTATGYKYGTKGTFSGETGGIIKSYNNHIEGTQKIERTWDSTLQYEPVFYGASVVDSDTQFDAYQVTSRNQPVPSTVKSLSGSTTYNNFDTDTSNWDLGVDPANITPVEEVPTVVKSSAGRMNGGDFPTDRSQFTIINDASNYSVDTEFKTAMQNYKSSLVSVGGLDAGSLPETTTNVEVSTETTTKTVEGSTETTTKIEEGSTETTTVNPSGAASMGTYVIGDGATGGDFNVVNNSTYGNINFSNVRSVDAGGAKLRAANEITFTLASETEVSIICGEGKDVILTDGTNNYTCAANTTTTKTVPAGSYKIKGSADSNSLVSKIVLKSTGTTPDPDPTPIEVKGDANGDGKVTRADMTMVLDFASGKISAVTKADLADVSGDGKVTAYDAYLIGKIILG